MRFQLTADKLREDRHAWMIDHETGAINEREIARRALADVRKEFATCRAAIANPTKSNAEKRCYQRTLDAGALYRWRRTKEAMTDSAKHISWQWRVAHGDMSDTHFLADVEIKGLTGPARWF